MSRRPLSLLGTLAAGLALLPASACYFLVSFDGLTGGVGDASAASPDGATAGAGSDGGGEESMTDGGFAGDGGVEGGRVDASGGPGILCDSRYCPTGNGGACCVTYADDGGSTAACTSGKSCIPGTRTAPFVCSSTLNCPDPQKPVCCAALTTGVVPGYAVAGSQCQASCPGTNPPQYPLCDPTLVPSCAAGFDCELLLQTGLVISPMHWMYACLPAR